MRATERSPYPSWGCTGQAAAPPSRRAGPVSVQRNMRAGVRIQLASKGRGHCTQACGRAAAAGQAGGGHRRATVGPPGKIEDDARSPPAQGDRGAASHPMPDRRPCLHMHARVRRRRRGRRARCPLPHVARMRPRPMRGPPSIPPPPLSSAGSLSPPVRSEPPAPVRPPAPCGRALPACGPPQPGPPAPAPALALPGPAHELNQTRPRRALCGCESFA